MIQGKGRDLERSEIQSFALTIPTNYNETIDGF